MQKFIDEVFYDFNFSEETLNQDNFINMEQNGTCPFNHCSNINFGATKAVLFFDNKDFVLKVPFITNDCGEEFCGPYFREDEIDKWDYCRAEEEIYADAVENGVGDFFLKIEQVGEVHGYPIYSQPKVEEWIDRLDIQTSEVEESLKGSKYEVPYLPLSFVAAAVIEYGYDKVMELFEFFESRDYDLDDFRLPNLGWYNGKPVFVDYGGYKS